MDKTSSRITLVAADPRDAQPAEEPPAAEEAQVARGGRRRAALALACLLRVAVIALLAHDIAPSAWRARHDPVELAVVAGPCTLLAAVFVCIHRAERLTPGSEPRGERRRLHVAVWVLSVPMFCLVAYQLSRAMPVAMVIAVWSFTSFLVLAGFYMLVLHQHQQYQDLDGVDAGDGNAFESTMAYRRIGGD